MLATLSLGPSFQSNSRISVKITHSVGTVCKAGELNAPGCYRSTVVFTVLNVSPAVLSALSTAETPRELKLIH